jgi:hypothetical protein
MKATWSVLALSCCIADASAAPLDIEIINDAKLEPKKVQALTQDFQRWGQRVYDYLHEEPDGPIKVVFSDKAGPGFYVGDRIMIRPDDDEMLETWIHELSHHVTGHDSSFFFKEGVATHVVEALYAPEHRVPQGWPNYGQTCDAWVSLYLARDQMPSLHDAMARDHYQGFPPWQDFRSWQIYCVGASFIAWQIRTQGLDAFRKSFAAASLGDREADLEKRWLDQIRAQKIAPFDPSKYLPGSLRYRYYIHALSD